MKKSGEDYLETIYVLSKNNQELHAIDIARKLNYSKPSVTRAMGVLKSKGYITTDELNHINLTAKGNKKAKEIYERHSIITKFLIGHGVSSIIAEQDACQMEHDISDETFSRMKAFTEKL